MSWGLSEAQGRFQGPRDALGARGASWKQGEQTGGFLRPQGGSRDPGMLRGEGSELGVREERWGLPSLLAPTEVVGTLKHSITYPSSLPLLPARSQFAPGSEPPGETFTT